MAEPDTVTQDHVRAEYARRRNRAQAAVEVLNGRENRLAAVRLTVFGVGLLIAGRALLSDGVSGAWILLPTVVFVVLVVLHDRLRKARAHDQRRVELYERGLSHLDGSWPGNGDDGLRFTDSDHPYSEHLDVFGKGSLFELISTARTPRGRETLAEWLGEAAEPDVIRGRQRAVDELRPRLNLREDVALLGAAAATGSDLAGLPDWGEAAAVLRPGALRAVALFLPVLTLAALAVWWPLGFTAFPFLFCLFLEWMLWRVVRERVGRVISGVDTPVKDMELLGGLLARLESESFSAPVLERLRLELMEGNEPASARIAALRRKVDLLDAGRNQFFAPFAALLLWPVQMAFAFEAWRSRSGKELRGWVDAAGAIEALSSLSGYAYEHPADPFPEIVEEGPLFDGEGLGHPLLQETVCVRNPLCVDATRRVYVVSGSNMSGKSTLLRTVGTNAVLALAGAPVRAQSLRISPLLVGASIHVHDSLLEGESRFYAEISRIAHIVQLAQDGDRPLLFLLDELFFGTNSGDRRVGASAVVRTLLERGSVGLLTTHDLELARIAEDLDEHVLNVHFEDRFEDDRMSFDYRIRPGVVERSNALALMRAVGLDV